MNDLDLLECCQSVLEFLCDKKPLLNFNDSVTLQRMDRILNKNKFYSDSRGTNMVNFMRLLSDKYNFDSPDIYDDGRIYFSDGFKFSEAPAKTFLKVVIREIKFKKLGI